MINEIFFKIDKSIFDISGTLEEIIYSNNCYFEEGKELRISNDIKDVLCSFIDNYDGLIKHNNISELVLNFENLIKIYFMYSDSLSRFLIRDIPQKELKRVNNFFSDDAIVDKTLCFIKKYNHLMTNNNSFVKIFFVIHKVSVLFNIKINLDDDKDEYIKALDDAIKEIMGIPDESGAIRGQFFLITLYIFHNYLPVENCFELSGESIIKAFKKFINSIVLSQDIFSPLDRLVEVLVIKELKKHYCVSDLERFERLIKVDDEFCLSHYTDIESLYYILNSKQLKFTRLDRVNDLNENKLLIDGDQDVYTASFTTKNDDLSLFGNYTNYEGISIQFGLLEILDTFHGAAGTDSDMVEFTMADVDYVYYDSSITKTYKKVSRLLMNKYSKYFIYNHLKHSITSVKKYINYFAKDVPWAYENEFRIVVPYKGKKKGQIFKSGKYEADSIFLNCIPKNLIKGITLGPEIARSVFKRKQVMDILKEFGLEKIQVVDTDSNMRISKDRDNP